MENKYLVIVKLGTIVSNEDISMMHDNLAKQIASGVIVKDKAYDMYLLNKETGVIIKA